MFIISLPLPFCDHITIFSFVIRLSSPPVGPIYSLFLKYLSAKISLDESCWYLFLSISLLMFHDLASLLFRSVFPAISRFPFTSIILGYSQSSISYLYLLRFIAFSLPSCPSHPFSVLPYLLVSIWLAFYHASLSLPTLRYSQFPPFIFSFVIPFFHPSFPPSLFILIFACYLSSSFS